MAKIKIPFNGAEYNIDESALSNAVASLKSHLSTTMSGSGATIELDGITYSIDSTKLSTAMNSFVSHLGTIAGSGEKVMVNGVEYSIGTDKISGALGELETVLGDMHSDPISVDPATGEILDSWEQIITSVNDGTYATKYAVGNYKPLDLGTEGVVRMQIAALNADVLSDGTGNAHITWIAMELLNTTHRMNSTSTNAQGWAVCEMRTYLSEDVWALIPADVRSAIVSVDKTYYNNDGVWKLTSTCSDKLWIPSWREVGLGTDKENDGVIYSELFTGNTSRNRTLNGSSTAWWLRSVYSGASFCVVLDSIFNNSGGDYQADFATGVLLGFCI